MDYRLRFTKEGNSKFIGHLDLLKMFQRAIRRAELPIKYSAGFNPHQEMSFALPLTLGMESVSEFIDVEFTKEAETSDIIEKLTDALPEGMKIIDAKPLPDKAKRGMALLYAQEFEIVPDVLIDKDGFVKFFERAEIIAEKKTKSGTKLADIKPDIISGRLAENIIFLTTRAGSERNLKVDLVMKCLYEFLKLDFCNENIKYKRIGLYKQSGDSLKLLDEDLV